MSDNMPLNMDQLVAHLGRQQVIILQLQWQLEAANQKIAEMEKRPEGGGE